MHDPSTILPAPRPPFMVKDTFVVKADLFPLGGTYNGIVEDRHLAVDAELERYVSAKLESLREDERRYHPFETDDPAGLAEALWRVFGLYAEESPGVVTAVAERVFDVAFLGVRVDGSTDPARPEVERLPGITPLGSEVTAWLRGREGLRRLGDALALSCQPDLVVMRALPDGADVAEWLHVCLPSGWRPTDKVGRPLREIHRPVADSARLMASSPNIVKAMVSKGPYVRFGWSVHTDPALNAHPDVRPPLVDVGGRTPAEVARLCYLRMERQTVFSMPDLDRSLFTVRTYVDPVVERVAAEPSLRPRLASLIASCSPEVLRYKGMADTAAPLLAWLTGGAAPTDPSP